MKNFFSTIFIALFLFLISIDSVNAIWVTNDNPIIYSSIGDWHSDYVSGPMIMKDEGKYKAWYQAIYNGHFSIGYAESVDGENWNKRETPVLIPSIEQSETDIVEASVIKKDNIYYLWYNTFESAKGNYKIGMATSSDGINWTKHPTPVLVGTNNWELAGVTDPSVIYHDGKFRMFYGGWGIPKSFRIGYAESNDGINWVKPTSQPLILPSLGHVNGASVVFYDNKYHLFYHTGGGSPTNIYHVVSSDLQNWQCAEENCTIIAADGTGFDSQMVTGPSVLNESNRQLLYYGGHNGVFWQIGLAINQLSQPQPKIIIIPGLFGSWNKQAVVYNQPVADDQWQLNPLATDYQGLIDTFANLGLVKNQDYYIYAYDWRKNLADLVTDFNEFIHTHNLDEEKINIVGHSLGGLIARAYVQQYQNQVEQVVTAGSPHQGVAQVYKALSAGEIEESNSLWFLAESLVLQLYRQGLETNREIMQNHLPILQDLLSTYPYLYNSQNQVLDSQVYEFNNLYLSSLNSNLTPFQPKFHTLAGEKADTIYAYKVGARTWLDKLLGFYQEGRPIAKITKIGDAIVPALSAKLDNSQTLTLDHGEIIRDKEAIKAILNHFDIDYQNEQIVAGKSVNLFPSLFFLIMSNAKLEVEINGETYQENQGLIHLPNYQNQPFKVRALGVNPGKYTILIGYLKESATQWLRINGEVPDSNPEFFSQEYALSVVDDELVLEPQILSNLINQFAITTNLDWQECQNYLNSNQRSKLQSCLLKFQHKLIQKLNKLESNSYPKLFQTLEYLENFYTGFNFSQKHDLDVNLLEYQFIHKTKIIASMQKSKLRNDEQGYLLEQIKQRLDKPNIIRLFSVKDLLSQIK